MGYGKKPAFTPGELRALRTVAEEQQDKMKGGRFWRNLDFALYLVIVVMVALGVRAFLFEPIRVDGTSMVPTLVHGEHMFVEKISYWTDPPARGDILICFYPGYTESCVKRVIGLPGDHVEVRDGRVYINDAALDESAYWNDGIWEDYAGTDVAAGTVFVMGDNRNGSKDSRNPAVGNIPYEKIVGKVRAVIWPPAAIRAINEVTYP